MSLRSYRNVQVVVVVGDASESGSERFFAKRRETDECLEEIADSALTTAIVRDTATDNSAGLVVDLCTCVTLRLAVPLRCK